MQILVKSDPVRMRGVRGEQYDSRPTFGVYICRAEAMVWDFNRTTWRLFGRLPVWHKDSDHKEVPMHEFIADCLGVR